jgi:GGDEF domain-containing protein
MVMSGGQAPTNGSTVETIGFDELTGVWNRPGFIAAATPMFLSCQRRAAPMALAYFDFHRADMNKSIALNATMQQVLVAMASQMRKAFRASDVIGRIDQLRFAVLLADCTNEALHAVEGVRAITDASTSADGLSLKVAMVRAATEGTLEEFMQVADVRAREVGRE